MLNHGAHSRKRRSARGQATVELALVAMLLALLVVGVADVARIYSEHLAAVHAAGVAARWATLSPNNRACSSYSSPRDVVNADLSGAIPPENILSVDTINGSNPSTVQVVVTYRHDFLFGLIQDVANTFTASSTMPGTTVECPQGQQCQCPPAP